MGIQSPTSQDILRLDSNRRPGATRGGLTRYQLNIVGNDVASVVASVGGWLFDRSMAGWEVHVLLADRRDVQPLKILGADTFELETGLSAIRAGEERAAGLAVALDLLGTDERIDALVRDASRCSDTEVVFWGDAASARGVNSLLYRLGAAARVFKSHAMIAASRGDVLLDSFETLFRKGPARSDSCLLPQDCLITQRS